MTITTTLLEEARDLRSVEGWKPSNKCDKRFGARIDRAVVFKGTALWVITAKADGKQYIYQPSEVCSLMFYAGGGTEYLGSIHIESLLLDRLISEYKPSN